jgi:DNA helicase MCM9
MCEHPLKGDMAVKENAHIRLHSLPYALDPNPNELNPTIAKIGSYHLGKLITVTGTIVKTGIVQMLESQKLYMCNRCKHR